MEKLNEGTARSRNGYIIFFAGFPILWNSHQQNEIALSSTAALLYTLKGIIPAMDVTHEMKAKESPVTKTSAIANDKLVEPRKITIHALSTTKLLMI